MGITKIYKPTEEDRLWNIKNLLEGYVNSTQVDLIMSKVKQLIEEIKYDLNSQKETKTQ